MADNDVSDLIMKFVGDEGAIAGETRTDVVLTRSKMAMGFTPGKMFEVQSFTFKTGLGNEDEDEMAEKAKKGADKDMKNLHKSVQKIAAASGINVEDLKGMRSLGYSKFRAGEQATYPVDIKPFELTRSIDIASPTLMQYCINRKVFKSATLIKRKAAGGLAAGEIFLRFDFNTVLLTNIDWDNDEPIKETIEFVCRAVTINYLPQLPDGSLGAEKQAFWTSSPGLTAEKLSA